MSNDTYGLEDALRELVEEWREDGMKLRTEPGREQRIAWGFQKQYCADEVEELLDRYSHDGEQVFEFASDTDGGFEIRMPELDRTVHTVDAGQYVLVKVSDDPDIPDIDDV